MKVDGKASYFGLCPVCNFMICRCPPATDYRDLARRLAEALRVADDVLLEILARGDGPYYTQSVRCRIAALLAEAEAAVGRKPAAPAATADWDDQHRG